MIERAAIGDDIAQEIKAQILTSEGLDRFRLSEKINDPEQTLVPNTSCGTCHSFNDLAFNFHALSYFQEMDVTIAPRVKNDVAHDLRWLRQRP